MFFSTPPRQDAALTNERSSGERAGYAGRFFFSAPSPVSAAAVNSSAVGRNRPWSKTSAFVKIEKRLLKKISHRYGRKHKKRPLGAPEMPERLMRHGVEISRTSGPPLELLHNSARRRTAMQPRSHAATQRSSFMFDMWRWQRRDANKRGPLKDRRYYT